MTPMESVPLRRLAEVKQGAFQVVLWIPAFAGMTKGEQE